MSPDHNVIPKLHQLCQWAAHAKGSSTRSTQTPLHCDMRHPSCLDSCAHIFNPLPVREIRKTIPSFCPTVQSSASVYPPRRETFRTAHPRGTIRFLGRYNKLGPSLSTRVMPIQISPSPFTWRIGRIGYDSYKGMISSTVSHMSSPSQYLFRRGESIHYLSRLCSVHTMVKNY